MVESLAQSGWMRTLIHRGPISEEHVICMRFNRPHLDDSSDASLPSYRKLSAILIGSSLAWAGRL